MIDITKNTELLLEFYCRDVNVYIGDKAVLLSDCSNNQVKRYKLSFATKDNVAPVKKIFFYESVNGFLSRSIASLKDTIDEVVISNIICGWMDYYRSVLDSYYMSQEDIILVDIDSVLADNSVIQDYLNDIFDISQDSYISFKADEFDADLQAKYAASQIVFSDQGLYDLYQELDSCSTIDAKLPVVTDVIKLVVSCIKEQFLHSAEISILRSSYDSLVGENKQLKESVKKAQDTFADYEEQKNLSISEFELERAKLQDIVEKKNISISDLEEKSNAIKDSNLKLLKECGSVQKEIEELKAENSEILTSSKSQLENFSKDNKSLESQIGLLKKEFDKVVTTNEAKVITLESENVQLLDNLFVVQEKMDSLYIENNELLEIISSIQDLL